MARGEIDRLMIFMPPGSAKSTYASVLFPPWLLAQNAAFSVIAASHTFELAERFGRRVRNLIGTDWRILGYNLAQDSQAAGRWDTDKGGEYYAAGVRGPITGRRADLALIDDPVKSREEADSEIIRERVKEWYQNDLYTRLKPDGRIVLIMTRWHEDDLAGWLLERQTRSADKWHVLSLPALAIEGDPIGREVGEPLWPEWQSEEQLARTRSAVDDRTWTALYQQNPQPDQGTFFQRSWFKRYVPDDLRMPSVDPYGKPIVIPKPMHRYGTSDYAVTDGGGDYTVHRIWGVDPQGQIWLLDGWRAQATSDVWVEHQCDLTAKHRPHAWFGEGGVIAKAVEPMLRRRLTERGLGCRLEWLPSIHDKPTRARGFQARAAMGLVHIPIGIGGDDILNEYVAFPAGKHDDEVDTAALLGRALDEVHPAIAASVKRINDPPDLNRWNRQPQGDNSWIVA